MSNYTELIKEKPSIYLDHTVLPADIIRIAEKFNEQISELEIDPLLDSDDSLSVVIAQKFDQIRLDKNLAGTSLLGDNLIFYEDFIWIQENKTITEARNLINFGKQELDNVKKIKKEKLKEIANIIINTNRKLYEKLAIISNNFQKDILIPKIYVIFKVNKSIQRSSTNVKVCSYYVIKDIWDDLKVTYYQQTKTNLYYSSVTENDLILLPIIKKIYRVPITNQGDRDRGAIIGKIILEENNIPVLHIPGQHKGFDFINKKNGKKIEVKVYSDKGVNKPVCIQFESNNPLDSNEEERDYFVALCDKSWKISNNINVRKAGFINFSKIKVKKRVTTRSWFKIKH